jgi:flagellum-specific peptidoglycan hydrolase FlgJ
MSKPIPNMLQVRPARDPRQPILQPLQPYNVLAEDQYGNPLPPPEGPIEEVVVTATAPEVLKQAYDFYDRFYAPLSELARQMGVPEEIIIGWSSYETGWGEGVEPGGKGLFGFSDNEIPRRYKTPEDSVEQLRGGQWFRRLANKSSFDDFAEELKKMPSFNSANPKYYKELQERVGTTRTRLKAWKQSRGLD